MADENPLYPERDNFDQRWGGLPVEAPRFNYTPQSSLIESEPRPIEPYKFTPIEGDPFERAAERLRAPYKHVNDIPEGKIPYRSNLPLIGEKFGHIIQSGATSPLAAFRGEFPVSDPTTGMATEEAIQRSQDVAALGGPGMGGLAKGDIIPGTGIESLRVFGKKLASDTSEPGMAVAAMRHPGYPAPEVIDRVYPAVRNIETGKVSTANRGNEHADILHKLWVKEGGDPRVDTMNLYRQMLPKHETGFYDPKTKQFHSKNEEEWRNLDTPDLNVRQAMRSGMVFEDSSKPGWVLAGLAEKPESWDRVLPAVKNIETGKISTTKRGNEHTDILHEKYPEAFETEGRFKGDIKENWNEVQMGYYDPRTKKFHDREDKNSPYYGVDSTALNPRKAMRSGMVFSDTQKPGMAVAAMQPTFYSAVEHAVNNVKQAKMPADQWLGTLSNAKGVKPEEMDWIGLKEHLSEKGKEPVTKQEIQDFVNANKTELKEVDKTPVPESTPLPRSEFTKYQKYQLPGGENYREKLLTLPAKKQSYNEYANKLRQKYGDLRDASNEELSKLDDIMRQAESDYRSSHWDEPNVLAHVRMNDRMVEGKKSLHLEEIQSDWHQTGREKGYKGTDKNLSPVDAAAIDAFGVPNAPFKKTWHELVLKRMLREAAEKGYDRLSWTPGETQAARYDLSKQIKELYYKKDPKTGDYDIGFLEHNGNRPPWQTVPENKLGDTVGKEIADKIVQGHGEKINTHNKLSNLDLRVGGEGMKGFYDKMIPLALEKIGKEHGVKVKTGNTNTEAYRSLAHFIDWAAEHRPALNRNQLAEKWSKGKDDLLVKQYMESQKPEPVHYIDIPQSLKDQALGKGFPLFSGGHMFTPVQGNPHDRE